MATHKISAKQKQLIIGKLLGDGHLESVTGKTFRLKIEHSLRQKEYVDWTYEALKSIAASPPRTKKQTVRGKEYTKYWFNSKYSSSLRFYNQQFYHGKKKIIPKLIHRWLTPLVLAVWFMDDGSVKSSVHRARIINTHSFSKVEIEMIISILKSKYDILAKLRKQKEGYQIMILAESAKDFAALIRPYMHQSMMYKLKGLD